MNFNRFKTAKKTGVKLNMNFHLHSRSQKKKKKKIYKFSSMANNHIFILCFKNSMIHGINTMNFIQEIVNIRTK